MDEQTLRAMLAGLQAGELGLDEAVTSLKQLPFEDLGFARFDHHRALRKGFPEVILGMRKTPDQLAKLFAQGARHHATVLATRVDPEKAAKTLTLSALDGLEYVEEANALVFGRAAVKVTGCGTIVVACAGTSDLDVAQEARLTAELMGNKVELLADIGVAGIHRLFAVKDVLEAASVVVVVAGMEGALASVMAGLLSCPVIAVPTSVGYGASFGGIAALLGMLSSCAPGVTVVNIDNGFGAGYAAAMINRARG